MDHDTKQRLADGKACLEAAIAYLAMGWSPLPLCPPDHVGIGGVSKTHSDNCSHKGKRPWILWKKYQDERPTEADLRYWWSQLPNSNVGLALGPVSGLIRIDVDGIKGEEALLALCKGLLPPTLEFRSGRKDGTGRGLLYRIPQGIVLRSTYDMQEKKAEIRFQARGSQTVLPPSRHSDGPLYQWTDGHSPFQIEAAIAPDWLLEELAVKTGSTSNSSRRSDDDWQEIFDGVPETSRNTSATAFIGKLLQSQKDVENTSAMRALYASFEAWNERNDPPLGDEELQGVFISILGKERRKRREEDQNRLSNIVLSQVQSSPSNGEVQKNGDDSLWHLIIVDSDPSIYKLRSPYWNTCPLIKDGYVVLTEEQIWNWNGGGKNSLPWAVFAQTKLANIPLTLKRWKGPDGILPTLIAKADHEERPPESKRQLLVLGFIFRYLASATARADKKDRTTRHGRPLLLEDGTVLFKLDHLKKNVRDNHEDFGHDEIMRIIHEHGFCPRWHLDARWWSISKESIDLVGCLTMEIGILNGNTNNR